MLRTLAALTMAALMTASALSQDSQPTSAPMSAPASGPTSAPADLNVGDTAPDFTLPDLLGDGATITLSEFANDHDYTVIVWNSVTCPYCVPYDAILPGLAAEYAAQGIGFLGINSNSTETDDEVTGHLTEAGFNYPVLRDEGNAIADGFGAEVTPEVFVLNPELEVLYHGRINDNPRDVNQAENNDLVNALNALAAGEDIPVASTNARGCTIKRVDM